MKPVWSFLTLTLMMVLSGLLGAQAEEIKDFRSDIYVNRDASLDVTENIDMDFGNAQRHGIYRIIPVQFQRYGASYTVPLTVTEITDRGDTTEFTTSRQDRDVVIKIGAPDKLVNGVHVYRIRYHVRRALNFFNKAPELYWNATGNEWPFTINSAAAVVHLPKGVNSLKTESFFGPPGSTEHAPAVAAIEPTFLAPHALLAGEGLTIVVGLPAGSITQPGWLETLRDALIDWWPAIALPAFSFGIMYLLWWTTGRDEDSNHPIAVEWNPPKDLTPAEVGTLVDESCDMEDIISTLLDLAVRGHLKIKQEQSDKLFFFSSKDYLFTKTDPPKQENLLAHETEFLNGIFGYSQSAGTISRLSDLKQRFYVHLPIMKKSIYDALTTKGLFQSNPDTVRSQYMGMSIFLFFVSIFFLTHAVNWGIGFILAGIVVACYCRAMPARSAAGSKATRECLGFARFVRLAEKDRIRVLAKDDPTLFGRILPYAIVLGAADQWAQAFEGLLTEPPDWYTPYGYGPGYNFSSRIFVNDLGYGIHTMGSTFSSVPTSSGSSAGSGGSGFSGGFSGGGFGGGGGGSW